MMPQYRTKTDAPLEDGRYRLTEQGFRRMIQAAVDRKGQPLADNRYPGVSKNTVTRIKQRRHGVRLSSLQKLFTKLNLTVADDDFENAPPPLMSSSRPPDEFPQQNSPVASLSFLYRVSSEIGTAHYQEPNAAHGGFLSKIHEALRQKGRLAIIGDTGRGKTQSAFQYSVYSRRIHQAYSGGVFWINAGDPLTLAQDFADLYSILYQRQIISETPLPETINAVRGKFEASVDWLLIFDNLDWIFDLPAEEFSQMVARFFPAQPQGNILFTSRNNGRPDLFPSLEVPVLSEDEGALLLVNYASRRGRILCLDDLDTETREAAQGLSRLMSHLPLALEGAGAFVRNEMFLTTADYYHKYQSEEGKELRRQLPGAEKRHAPVAASYLADFRHLIATTPTAADVLKLSAFFPSDRIPLELLQADSAAQGNESELIPALETALQRRLIEVDSAIQAIRIHQIRRDILHDSITEAERFAYWRRAIRAIDLCLTEVKNSLRWKTLARVSPAARCCCRTIIEYPIETEDARVILRVLNRLTHLTLRYFGDVQEADTLCNQATALRERFPALQQSEEHSDTLFEKGSIHRLREENREAARAFARSARLHRAIASNSTPEALRLNRLAVSLFDLKKYTFAEYFLYHAMEIVQRTEGEYTSEMALNKMNLSGLYIEQGKYDEAEQLINDSLTIRRTLYPHGGHPIGVNLLYRGNLHRVRQNLKQANADYNEAQTIFRRFFPDSHYWNKMVEELIREINEEKGDD